MTQYEVFLRETIEHRIVVEADSERDAQDRALLACETGDVPVETDSLGNLHVYGAYKLEVA